MRRYLLAFIIAACGFGIAHAIGQVQKAKLAAKVVISADELNTKYEVRGPLGSPLGEVVSVVCRRGRDVSVKGEPEYLEAISVNGKTLRRPVRMEYGAFLAETEKELVGGGPFTLRVYQTGGFTGVPSSAMRETTPIQTHGYQFTTHLVVLKRLK